LNVVLTTLNSRYTHMSLSLRYLRAALERRFNLHAAATAESAFADGSQPALPAPVLTNLAGPGEAPLNLRLLEFTINQPHEHILRTLFETQPDVLCFSVYIWNVEATLKLAASLKKVLPETIILFGGPESAYDSEAYLEHHDFIDVIVTGEGEEILGAYLERKLKKTAAHAISGLTERTAAGILNHGKAPLISDLDRIPFPYKAEDFGASRMLYYEASRGCPYRCAYCLSSREPGVRTFSMDRVKEDLARFIKAEVMQVKFVDRTFNVDSDRTREIFKFLIENDNGITGFHFEITAALLGEQDFELLEKARPGQFQFEIGVQSTCEEAMTAVMRPLPFGKTSEVCRRLKALGNIHLHLDLIAGLPFETYERFLKSFDEVFDLRPHALQLGFLKLIPGSPLSEQADQFGYVRESHPPYEVLGNAHMNFEQLTSLKRIEALVDLFYNSGGFSVTLEAALEKSGQRPSAFFLGFSEFIKSQGYDQQAYRSEAHYGHLEAFLQAQSWYMPVFKTLLDYDCLVALAKRRITARAVDPQGREPDEPPELKAAIHEALRASDPDVPVKTLLKRIRYQIFDIDMTAWLEGRRDFDRADHGLWLGWVDTARRSAVSEHYDYAQARLEVTLWKS